MLFLGQFIALVGLVLAFIGSVYLARRVFTKIVSLKFFLQKDYQKDLTIISDYLDIANDAKKAVHALIKLLNVVLVDIEAADKDTYERAKKGIAFLVTGAILQGVAIVLVLFSPKVA